MKMINPMDYAETILKALPKGVFLTTAADGKENTMTIGWGSLGNTWSKPTFTVMVRKSRYTHQLIEKHNEFTLSFPLQGNLSKALGICGTKSGRDCDKFMEASLETVPGKTVNVPIISGAGLHLECRILEKRTMLAESFDTELKDKWYADNDWHTYYTGEITAAYLD